MPLDVLFVYISHLKPFHKEVSDIRKVFHFSIKLFYLMVYNSYM